MILFKNKIISSQYPTITEQNNCRLNLYLPTYCVYYRHIKFKRNTPPFVLDLDAPSVRNVRQEVEGGGRDK